MVADPLRRRARLLLTLLAYTHTRFPPEKAPALVGMLRAWLDTWGQRRPHHRPGG